MNARALTAYVFYCAHHLEAGQLSVLSRVNKEDAIKTVGLPCSGKVDIPYLVKAFELGADGVVIVTCKRNQCRLFEGNLRARKRAAGTEALLQEMGVTGGRMAVFECDQQDREAALAEIGHFLEQVRSMPPALACRREDTQPEKARA